MKRALLPLPLLAKANGATPGKSRARLLLLTLLSARKAPPALEARPGEDRNRRHISRRGRPARRQVGRKGGAGQRGGGDRHENLAKHCYPSGTLSHCSAAVMPG